MPPAPRLRLDRNELAGSFGDLGTDLPLLVGMIQACGLDAAAVLVCFGALQVATGVAYGLPMPVQPLKAMAAIAITQKLAPGTLYGGGLAIGLAMLFLTAGGLLERLAAWVPKCAVRGVQLGLGLTLMRIALARYVPGDGSPGLALAAAAFALALALRRSRRWPAALFIVGLGAAYALAWRMDLSAVLGGLGPALPVPRAVSWADVAAGFWLLALPQLPLSLSNSVLATHQLSSDLFPGRAPGLRKIGWTYSAMNLACPWLGGVPVCHGSGGMAGHHAFGGRTGGSAAIYGSFYLAAGLLASGVFAELIRIFPLPVLGVLLFFEGLALTLLLKDLRGSRLELAIAVAAGLAAATLPQGYLIGMAGGALAYRLAVKVQWDR